MPPVHFDPDAHLYWWHDGARWYPLRSVTQVLSNGPGWTSAAMRAGAMRGKAVHTATAAYEQGGAVWVPDDCQGYVDAYLQAREDRHAEWVYIEQVLANPALGVAGTVDRFGLVGDTYTVVDLKTATTPARNAMHGHQLAGYAVLLDAGQPERFAREAWLLHPDGTYTVKAFDAYGDIEYFLARAATARGDGLTFTTLTRQGGCANGSTTTD